MPRPLSPSREAAPNVIFLDVDGVLNHDACPDWQDSHHVLDPECVARVRAVCLQTGARLVISSTWRLGDASWAVLRAALGDLIIGETPYLTNPDHSTMPRRNEIAAWICDHRERGACCIVDDDLDATLAGVPFVRTFFSGGGFTQEKADEVRAVLARSQEPPK